MSKLKKFVASALIATICTITFASPATADAKATTENSYTNETDNPFTLLEEKGFQIITSANTYSTNTYSLNRNQTDLSDINSHLLLDQQIFSSALSNQSAKMKEAIYNGNIIAVFDNSNKVYDYEKELGLPIGFLTPQNSKNFNHTRNHNAYKNDTHKSIGYIYQVDELGSIHITRVNTLKRASSNENDINTFANILLNYEPAENSTYTMSRATSSTKFLGTIADYYKGSDKKGDVNVVYEVSTVQDIDGYDYYAIHAYIDATPGDALYDSGYDLDELYTSLSALTNATLYKTGPNTKYEAKSYTVDMGIEGSKKDGLTGSFNFSWTKEIPVVDIKKNVLSSTKCEWIVDIDDWDDDADNTLTFEPGGIFRIVNGKELAVLGNTVLTVDRWNKFPSTALAKSTAFYCIDDSLNPGYSWK